ncbi:MAG: hypothetical protein KBG60_02855 [Anaerolineaceae bacterium]|nr:hypothetical protein [Anaerolineaceae bacterium]
MTLKSVHFPAVVFRADHPFLFLIREKTTGASCFWAGSLILPETPGHGISAKSKHLFWRCLLFL